MKTPTQYGSENEESSFIRRIAAPDRANAKRKQKKRLAVVGATVGLIAASAAVGYAAMRQGGSGVSTVGTEQLDAKAKASHDGYDDYDEDEPVFPTFAELDVNGNEMIERAEFTGWLKNRLNSETAMVEGADIPEDIKEEFIGTLKSNYNVQKGCVVRTYSRMERNEEVVTRANFDTLLVAVEEFCPVEPIKITPQFLNKYTKAPPPPPDTPQDSPSGWSPADPTTETPGEPVISLTNNEEKKVAEEVKDAIQDAVDNNNGEPLTDAQEEKIEDQVRDEYIEEKKEEQQQTETETLTYVEEKEVAEEVKNAIQDAVDNNGGESLTDAQEEKIEDQVRDEYIEDQKEEADTLTIVDKILVDDEVENATEDAEEDNGGEPLTDAQKEKIEGEVREDYIEEKKDDESISIIEELVIEEQVERAIEKAEDKNGDESLTPCDVKKIEEQVREEAVEDVNLSQTEEKELQEEVKDAIQEAKEANGDKPLTDAEEEKIEEEVRENIIEEEIIDEEIERAIELVKDLNGGEPVSHDVEEKIEDVAREDVKIVLDEVEKAIENVEEKNGGDPLSVTQEEKIEEQVRLELLEKIEEENLNNGEPLSKVDEEEMERVISSSIEMHESQVRLENEKLDNGDTLEDEILTNVELKEVSKDLEKTLEKAEDMNGGESLSPVEEKKIEVEVLKEIVEEKKEEENLDHIEEEEIEDEVEKVIEQTEDQKGGGTLSSDEKEEIEVDVITEHIEEKKEEENLSSDEEKDVEEEVEKAIEEAEKENGSDTLSPVDEKKIELDVVDDYIDKKEGEIVVDTNVIQNIIDEKKYMTKHEFHKKLTDHFEEENKYLDAVIKKANAESEALTAKIDGLNDCIDRAASKFGWYGAYEEAPHFENAIDWVANVCKNGLD